MSSAKAHARSVLRSRRATLDPADLAARSAGLADVVLADPCWSAAGSIAAFVGVRGEPDTEPLLRAALDGGKALYLPRVLPGTSTFELRAVASLHDLVPGPHGLREPDPRGALLPDLAVLELILIPGLAFSCTGGRIGTGAGFYDRALASLRDLAVPVRMGLCLSEFLDPHDVAIPAEPHDVPMHCVATERGVAPCR